MTMAVIEINKDPTRRQLNQFGLIWMVFFCAVGALAWFRTGRPTLATALWVAAVVVPLLGWAWPRFMRLVFIGMTYLAWPIGFVVSHVVLAVVYYLVLTPIGLVLRLAGHDPMSRRFDRDAESYWHRRESAPVDPGRYFRQF